MNENKQPKTHELLTEIVDTLNLYYSIYLPQSRYPFEYPNNNKGFNICFGFVPDFPALSASQQGHPPTYKDGFVIFNTPKLDNKIQSGSVYRIGHLSTYVNNPYYKNSGFTISNSGLLTITKKNGGFLDSILITPSGYYKTRNTEKWSDSYPILLKKKPFPEEDMDVIELVYSLCDSHINGIDDALKKSFSDFLNSVYAEYEIAKPVADRLRKKTSEFDENTIVDKYTSLNGYIELENKIIEALEGKNIPPLIMKRIKDKFGFESIEEFLSYLYLIRLKSKTIENEYTTLRNRANRMRNKLEIERALRNENDILK